MFCITSLSTHSLEYKRRLEFSFKGVATYKLHVCTLNILPCFSYCKLAVCVKLILVHAGSPETNGRNNKMTDHLFPPLLCLSSPLYSSPHFHVSSPLSLPLLLALSPLSSFLPFSPGLNQDLPNLNRR